MKQTIANSMQDRRTPLERRLAARIRHAPIGQCLTFEQFMELARRGRHAPEYHAHMLHVVSCPACRRAYLNLRALTTLQRPSLVRWLKRFSLPSMPHWTLALGVTASVFALAVWVLYPKSNNSNIVATRPDNPTRVNVAQNIPKDTNAGFSSPSQGNPAATFNNRPTPSEPSDKRDTKQWVPIDQGRADSKQINPSSPLPNRKSDGTNGKQKPNNWQTTPPSIPKKRDSTPRGGARQSPSNISPDSQGGQTMLAQQPSSGSASPASPTSTLEQRIASAAGLFRLPLSKVSETLASLTSGSVRRSGNTTTSTGQVRFVEPDLRESILLEEDSPLFQWKPVANATRYTVTLQTRAGNPIHVDELPPEQTSYRPPTPLERGKAYTVTIQAEREGLSTLSGTLRFEVMSADDLQDLRAARANMQKHPEASGIIFYRLQRYREALEAFEIAKQRNPEDPEIQRIVERLRNIINN